MMRLRLLPLAVLTAVLAFGHSAAGPPFLTDDPEPVPYRHWEAYLFSTWDRTPGGTDVQGPAVEVNFGAAPGLQLHLVVPRAAGRPRGDVSRSGLGDVEVGAKLRFVRETKHRPQIGIFPMAELATGDATRGLGNGRTWYRIPLWIQKSRGPWTTYGGAGWIVNPARGQRDHAFGGVLAQRAIGERLTLGGEIFAEGADAASGRGTTLANAGGYLDLGRGFSLLFSAGRSIRGERHDVAYLGLYRTWGPGG